METNGCRTILEQVKQFILRLTDSALIRLSTYTSLTQIICVSNKIESLDSLKPLSSLKKLQEIDFTDNPVSLLANYRTILFDSYL